MKKIPYVKAFGRKLRARRELLKLSLRHLGKASSTSHQTISAFEDGMGTHLPTLIRICQVLGFRVDIVDARKNYPVPKE